MLEICKTVKIIDNKQLFQFCPDKKHEHTVSLCFTFSNYSLLSEKALFVDDIDDIIISDFDCAEELIETLRQETDRAAKDLCSVSITFKEIVTIKMVKEYGTEKMDEDK